MPVWTSILIALGVLVALGSCIAMYDVQNQVASRLREELRRLRSHAERSATQLESQLADERGSASLDAICDSPWLRNYWRRNVPRQPGRLYAAVSDPRGIVIAHTQRTREGMRIEEGADALAGPLPAGEINEITDPALAPGHKALDMRVPIHYGGQRVGLYHAGIDVGWLDTQLARVRQERSTFWLSLIGGTCGIVLLSSVMIVQVTRNTARLEHELELAHARRTTEMHELVLGIAHEIRNPLNAIRLNLHTIEQVVHHDAELPDDEMRLMLSETASEIDRMEGLMREMLGFARENPNDAEPIDLSAEVQRTLAFLRNKLEQSNVQVYVDSPPTPATVSMNRTRLRQVLLNLLNNACDAMQKGGRVDIQVRQQRGQVELTVIDTGPGVAAGDRERVFVPFYSTKAAGAGLGLALARKQLEEAGGTIVCEQAPGGKGCQFRVILPAHASSAASGVAEVATL